jgi:hypothetical protein
VLLTVILCWHKLLAHRSSLKQEGFLLCQVRFFCTIAVFRLTSGTACIAVAKGIAVNARLPDRSGQPLNHWLHIQIEISQVTQWQFVWTSEKVKTALASCCQHTSNTFHAYFVTQHTVARYAIAHQRHSYNCKSLGHTCILPWAKVHITCQ